VTHTERERGGGDIALAPRRYTCEWPVLHSPVAKGRLPPAYRKRDPRARILIPVSTTIRIVLIPGDMNNARDLILISPKCHEPRLLPPPAAELSSSCPLPPRRASIPLFPLEPSLPSESPRMYLNSRCWGGRRGVGEGGGGGG